MSARTGMLILIPQWTDPEVPEKPLSGAAIKWRSWEAFWKGVGGKLCSPRPIDFLLPGDDFLRHTQGWEGLP